MIHVQDSLVIPLRIRNGHLRPMLVAVKLAVVAALTAPHRDRHRSSRITLHPVLLNSPAFRSVVATLSAFGDVLVIFEHAHHVRIDTRPEIPPSGDLHV